MTSVSDSSRAANAPEGVTHPAWSSGRPPRAGTDDVYAAEVGAHAAGSPNGDTTRKPARRRAVATASASWASTRRTRSVAGSRAARTTATTASSAPKTSSVRSMSATVSLPRRRPATWPVSPRLVLAAALGLVALLWLPPAASAAARRGPLYGRPAPTWAQRPPQTLVLTARRSSLPVYVYRPGAPPDGRQQLIRLRNPTPQGLPLILAGFEERDGFVLALLPVRPNNTYGWVRESDVTLETTPMRIEVSTRRHELLLWKGRTVVGEFPVAVGARRTPTPLGSFFVNTIVPAPNPAYGTVVISTSGYSEVYDTFGDGDAAVGIHGTDADSSVGHDASHGCVRMHTADAQLLARQLALGTLVVIHP